MLHDMDMTESQRFRTASLFAVFCTRGLLYISGSGDRNGETSDASADSQDPELTSALAYLSELKEKLNVYKLTGENQAGSVSFHGVMSQR